MNARIASILKDRISQFTYVDRIAGMVRTAQMERAGQVVKLPVAIDVDDDLACDASTLRDMVPDEAYACMVYFEDRGFQRITSRTRGTSFRSSIRMVCWVNTAKFGGDPMAGERIMQQFMAEVHQPGPVNTDTLVGLRTTAETSPERGGGLFGAYTYPESSRQYLLWPFDAFAIDIAAEYRLRPGCEEEPVPGDDSCWTPPTTKRRRNPSEFTCEELQDPETGLTAEQLGPECLDCEGGGECPDTTVNGVTSDTPTISVRQGGVEVGTLNPATGVHEVPECEPCPPCDPVLEVGLNGGRPFTQIELACGLNTYDIELTREDGTPIGEYDTIHDRLEVRPGQVQLRDTAGNDIGAVVNVEPESSGNIITAPDALVQLRDSAGNLIGSPDSYRSNSSSNKTAPDGSVQRRDSAGTAIGSLIPVRSNQTGLDVTCPDGSVTVNSTPVGSVKSNGALNIPVTLAGAPATGAWTGSAYDVTHPARVIREYTSSDVWTKPAGLREVFVLVAGAGGGGGGAGRRAGAITGASGGGGGAVRWLRIDASSLGPTETVTIGAGGTGGPGSNAGITATAGGAGGASSFGSHISAAGGSGGGTSASSGTIAGGAGGTTAGIRFFLPGAAGGQAQAGADGSAGTNGWGQATSGAGGGGGGSSTSTPASWAGGAGGGVFEWGGASWALVAGPTGPPASSGSGSAGTSDQCLHLLQSFLEVPTIGLGTGGAGGAGAVGSTGGNGGAGGRAAGGGGAGSAQSGTGGTGGTGGDGFCIVVEIY